MATLSMERNTEIICRNFVITRFRQHTPPGHEARKKIDDLARIIILATTNAHGDIIAAVRGMIEGIEICAQDSHLNVQSAICEAATAAYDVALEQGVELAENIRKLAEGSHPEFPIVLYKHKTRSDFSLPSA